jgi:hypothetical protein
MALCMQLQLVGWAAPTTGDSISACSEILSLIGCGIQKEIACVTLKFAQEKLQVQPYLNRITTRALCADTPLY